MIAAKKLYYFGENKDFSDKWLIKTLNDYFLVILIKPTSRTPINNANCIINRLYVSAYKRYNKKQINNLLLKLKKLRRFHCINSVEGFLLEYDRIKQYKFFNLNNIAFTPTKPLTEINANESIKFPIILKNNHSGRNKKLNIINNISDLIKIPTSIQKELVAQHFFKNKLCYRTEFIGDTILTFP